MRPRTCECGECRKCKRRLYMREWYARHPGYASASVRRRRAREGDVLREYDRLREQTQTARRRASRMVRAQVRRGKILPQPCEWCGAEEKTEVHHRDYNKPLDVMWLCRKHHGEWHRNFRAIMPGETGEMPPRR